MANIKQVAAKAGVSPSCVSKYLKNADSVRPDTREKVEDAIRALNYVPSSIARLLRMGKSMTVKVIMPSVTLPFFAGIFEYLRLTLLTAGYNLILQTISPGDTFHEQDFIFVDGAIVAFPNDDSVIGSLSGLLKQLNKPLVTIHGYSSLDVPGLISVDIAEGMSQASRYMQEHGRKNIAYVDGTPESTIVGERFRGFSSVVPPECRFGVFNGDFSMQWGYTAAHQMLDSNRIPDGILCGNDGIAAGIIKYMLIHGVSVPGDVWVFGFDNIPLSEMYTPSISSVSIPSQKMCEVAVQSLIAAMNDGELSSHRFNAELVLRDSTSELTDNAAGMRLFTTEH